MNTALKNDFYITEDMLNDKSSPFRKLSRAEILADLEEAEQQRINGEFRPFDEALNEMRKKYGFI